MDLSRTPDTLTPARPRRNPRLVALGVLVICLGGLGSGFLYTTVANSQQVLKINRTVHRGEVLRSTDFAVITLGSTPGLASTSAERIDTLVGRTALVDLPAGSLVDAANVGSPDVPPGWARVGLRVGPGRLPVTPLPAGTPVLLVAVTGPGFTEQTTAIQASIEAEVASSPVVQTDGSSLLDVSVPVGEAERVARLAAAEQLAVVRQAVR